ncbi:MAG: DUF2341 domain-containing protein [Candidatus Thorarchaeota archaeon]
MSSTSWYNTDWKYRKIINVTTGSVAVSSNYAVSLTLDHALLVKTGKSRADGNDIRVLYLSGSDWVELDRILDSGSLWNSNSTQIWFKIQTAIPASSNDSNYFLYYGNSLADSPPNNSTNIFLFYDDFESGNFNLWDGNYTETGDSIIVSSDQAHTGNYSAKAQVDDVSLAQAMIWKDFSGQTSLFTRIYIYLDPSFYTSDHVTVMQLVDISTGWQNLLSATIHKNMTLYMWNDFIDDAYGFGATNTISKGNWHLLEMQASFSETMGEARLWLDGNLEIEETMVNLSDSSSIRFSTGYYWGDPKNESNTLYVDNAYLRPWVNPEPTLILSMEEIFRPSLNDFTFYKEITIDHTNVFSNLIDFPVLISLLDSDLHDQAQGDGDDIAFYNGTDWLDHEIELFNQSFNITHAQLVAWVRIPLLSNSTDTKIYMYYGNTTMSSLENPIGVWDPNYVGVWHLSEDPTSPIPDSTGTNYDGTSYGTMNSSDQIPGKIDGSLQFDGVDDYIDCGNDTSLDLTGDLTLQYWVMAYNVSNDPDTVTKGSYTDAYSSFIYRDSTIYFRLNGIGSTSLQSQTKILLDKWVSVTCTRLGSTMKIFINGTQDPATGTFSEMTEIIIDALTIARSSDNLEGIMDEIRLSNIARSAEWIITEYNNQYDPTSFYSISTEKSKLARNADYFTYCKVISIDHTKVSGSSDHVNFPVLISISDTELHDHTQADGDDIAFYSGTKWLDHEIELFNKNGTHAQLVAWVRVPSLSYSIDTNITIYYGNSTMESQENPSGVWDPNYVGVWHLKESGTGMEDEYLDSSHFGNHGQGGLGNVSYIPNQTTGTIGFGQNFTNHFIDCGNETSIDITNNQITLQLWMKYPATHPWMGPFNKKGYYSGYRLTMEPDSQYMRYQLPGNESDLETSQSISPDIWHHVVATYNGSLMRIYVDGIPDPANLTKTNDVVSAFQYPFRIGHGDYPEGEVWSYPWLGQIDEVRISNIGRSADWIDTEYNNQYDPNSFYSIGNEIQIEDTSPPDITINLPNPDDLFGLNAPDYNLTVTDANFDSIWYSLDSGVTNSTPVAATGTINQSMWSARPDGNVTIQFYANDTYGNFDYEEVTVEKDTLAPTINITEPLDYEVFGNIPPNVSITVNDANLDTILYQLENASVITSNYTWTEFIAQSVWNQVGNGTVTITFYANDTLGNLNYTDIEVYKDIYVPIITIDIPTFDDVYNETAPNFTVNISGSNLDARWYTLDDGFSNHTFLGLTGIINQSAWDDQGDGPVIIKFYLNNTLGVVGFDEVSIIKDTLNPTLTLNLPLNNTYCREAPIINVLATDANLDLIWYEVNTSVILLGNNINQQLDPLIWGNLSEGEFYIYIYANDSVSHLNDSLILVLYKDTIAPAAPMLIDFPQGNVNGTLIFDWNDGSDPSGIIKYRLIIDNEPNPLTTLGYIFEVNVTESYYEYTETLQPGDYYFFLYQIDGAGHHSPASTGSFTIISSSPTSKPPEFPLLIIIVIICAAVGGVVGIVVLKKSKSKKAFIPQIPEKKPEIKPKLEIHEELRLLDYEVLKNKSREELNSREEKLLEHIKSLEENKEYTKEAEFIGQLMLIENILGNYEEEQLYRQKQIDVALKGLEYLKNQYEIESKKAAVSGDYSKALELYNESKLISDNLKMYLEGQESSNIEEVTIEETIKRIETMEPQMVEQEVGIVYSCINDLLTKFFDEIGIKYYSNPQLYDDVQNQIHGLILPDNQLFTNIDPTIINKIKSIQIIYTEDISYENIVNLCKEFQNLEAMLIIVGIKWPKDIKSQTIEVPLNNEINYQENIRIIHHELFFTLIGLKGIYVTAFNEIIDLYNKSNFDILRETHESSEIIIHNTDELINDLKEQGLIEYNLSEFFHK